MATLKIYKTQIVPERNFLVQDIDEYLNSLTPTYTDTNFQFVKPYLDTSIKIEISLDTWGTADIDNTSLTPMLGNYLSITESLDNSNKTFYYYIIGAAFTADGTVSLQISLDTINTYSDYLYNVNNYTAQTNISRETATRWKYDTNLRYKPIIDKYSESLDLSPACYKRNTYKKILEPDNLIQNINWYAVYKTANAVSGSGESGASANAVSIYLMPSSDFEITNYSYTGDYPNALEAQYDGGYEPVTAPNASVSYGTQLLTTDRLGDVDVDVKYSSSGNYLPWNDDYLVDNFDRRWNRFNVYLAGNSPDNTSSPSLYITTIYYNSSLDKYIAIRGYGSYAYIYTRYNNTYYYIGTSGSRLTFPTSSSSHVTEAEVEFTDLSEISLSATGGACEGSTWIYNNKINIRFKANYSSLGFVAIKSYNSTTQTYSDTFYSNTPTGSTVHTVTDYITGYDSLDRTDSKLIKIIRLPYCPVKQEKVDYLGGYTYVFDGFSISDHQLIKSSGPTEALVNLQSNTNTLTYVSGFMNWSAAPVNTSITTDYLFNDPKLQYGQDTLIRKYAFDNQILNMPYEKYDFNSEGLPRVKDDITYMHTREIASDLLFTIKPDDSTDNAESYTNYDYGDILLSSRNLEEPILNNDYLNYMRYGYNYEKTTMENNIQAQQISTGISTGVSIVGGTAAGALAGAKMGAAAGGYGAAVGAVVGGVIGLASSILSSTSKIITTNASIDAARNSFNQKIDTLRNQSTSVRSNNAVDLFDKYAGVKLTYLEYAPVDELKVPIAKLYHYCGYAHPVQETPKWCRYWFDFIQCSPVFKDNIFKNIYGNYQQDIIYRFENGVTVLHNRGTSLEPAYNWEQDKQNWEADLTVEPEIKSITVGTTKYTKTGNTVVINGITYYTWSAISVGRFTALTLAESPSVGDTAYIRRLITGPVTVLGEIAHVNWGV